MRPVFSGHRQQPEFKLHQTNSIFKSNSASIYPFWQILTSSFILFHIDAVGLCIPGPVPVPTRSCRGALRLHCGRRWGCGKSNVKRNEKQTCWRKIDHSELQWACKLERCHKLYSYNYEYSIQYVTITIVYSVYIILLGGYGYGLIIPQCKWVISTAFDSEHLCLSASWCAQAAKYRTVAQAAYADIAVPWYGRSMAAARQHHEQNKHTSGQWTTTMKIMDTIEYFKKKLQINARRGTCPSHMLNRVNRITWQFSIQFPQDKPG